MTELKTKKKPLFVRAAYATSRKRGVRELTAALFLILGVYVSQLLHLLEAPLFSKVYYGNLNSTFFAVLAALYIYLFAILFHRRMKKRFGISPFQKFREKFFLKRKLALYIMTVLPIVLTAAALNFKFKIIFELGERITGMTLVGNAVGYIYAAAKIFCAIYVIFLVEDAFDNLFERKPRLPYGGLAAMLTFGFLEMLFANSMFAWLYFALFLYFGVIYLASGKAFAVTYAISMILYVL